MHVDLPRRVTTVLSAAASLFLASASAAAAYNLEGPRWVGSGIPTSGCCASLRVQYASTVAWDGITYLYWTTCGTTSCFSSADAYLNYYYTRSYSAATTQGVAAHELGHAMGIGHAVGCVVMVATTSSRNSCGIYGPTTDDVNGINRLY